MDRTRLDALVKTLIAETSRRRTLRGLVGGTLGILGLSLPDEAAAAAKCKPTCDECATCKKGKCRKTRSGKKKCKKGKCRPKANGTTCSRGECHSGRCGPVVRTFATPGASTFAEPRAGTLTVDVLGAGGGTGGRGGDGAGGATGGAGGPGGNGGKVTATFAVAAGEVLQINVGAVGGNGGDGTASGVGGAGGPGGAGGASGSIALVGVTIIIYAPRG